MHIESSLIESSFETSKLDVVTIENMIRANENIEQSTIETIFEISELKNLLNIDDSLIVKSKNRFRKLQNKKLTSKIKTIARFTKRNLSKFEFVKRDIEAKAKRARKKTRNEENRKKSRKKKVEKKKIGKKKVEKKKIEKQKIEQKIEQTKKTKKIERTSLHKIEELQHQKLLVRQQRFFKLLTYLVMKSAMTNSITSKAAMTKTNFES